MELIRNVKIAQVGEIIAVISSDEGSKKDIPAWAAKAGQEFLGTEPVEGATRFVVRKAR
jgi:TusA-related sulfurtransferase